MITFKEFLQEKLIVLNNGAKYGQICVLAGGSASGKSFAASQFLEGELFKSIDPDKLKTALIKLSPELSNVNLTKPEDVRRLHDLIKSKGLDSKVIDLLFTHKNKGTLPNVMFDKTLKSDGDLGKIVDMVIPIGYQPKNIHLVYVLTNYQIAFDRNKNPERGRVVPDDILLTTHQGPPKVLLQLLKNGPPNGFDGAIHVILNNGSVMTHSNRGKPITLDFTYLTIKNAGQPIKSENEWEAILYNWLGDNIPGGWTYLNKLLSIQ